MCRSSLEDASRPRLKPNSSLVFVVWSGAPCDECCVRPTRAPRRPEKKREPSALAERHVLPMELQLGDRLVDQSEEWKSRAGRTPRLESLAATIDGAPLLIPDLETSDVQLKGPHAGVWWDPFH